MSGAVRTGRAVVLNGPDTIALTRLDVPPPPPGGVVARVEFGGVCGSDAHMLKGEFPLPFAIVLGHEGIGVLEDLGAAVTHDHAGVPVALGDRVYWCPIAPCHHCWHCTVEKDFSRCANATWFGPTDEPTWGSYADYVTLSRDTAFYRIPDGVPSEAVIAFGCALPAVLQGLERAGGVKPMQSVVVQGCGPIGLAAVLMAKLSGARSIVAIDASPLRLDFARRFGATTILDLAATSIEERAEAVAAATDGRGADMVIEGTGHRGAFAEGLQLCAGGGTYLLIGLWASQGEQPFDPSLVVQKSMRLVGTQYAQAGHYHDAMQVAARHHADFPFAELITHRCALEEARQAIDLVTSGRAGKVVIAPARHD